MLMSVLLQVFKELFDAVIDDRHKGFAPTDKHPAPELDADQVSLVPM
jgi:hypothetical protein